MLLNCDEHGKSLLKRIGELETYNRQINRLEEVRLLRLQHAKNKLLRRSFDEVSVLSFGCTASCGSPQQAQSPTDASNRSDASDLAAIRGTTLAPLEPRKEWSPDAKADADGGAQKLADSWQAQLHSTRAKLKNRHDQLEQLEQLQQQSSTIQEKLRHTHSMVEQATAAAAAATQRRLRDAARARVRNTLNEELRAQAAAEQLRQRTQRQAQAAQNFGCSKAAMSDVASSSKGNESDNSPGVFSLNEPVTPQSVQQIILGASAERKVA
ncbi:unnamed protein product [Durusdinium trenchii]|uniref:Uncharacterized protein n=1 Tax=Durusdinium trenchii TaxID=1381693 RepID=A0ABP0R9W6_9DINO